MGPCSSKFNNIRMDSFNLKNQINEELDISSEIIQELSINKNLLSELLDENPVSKLVENNPVSKLVENTVNELVGNNPVSELVGNNIIFSEIKEKVLNELNNKFIEMKQDIIKENLKLLEFYSNNVIKESENIKKFNKYKKELKKLYINKNKHIEIIKDEINSIFDEKIEKINILIENYNLRLNEIETLFLDQEKIFIPMDTLNFIV